MAGNRLFFEDRTRNFGLFYIFFGLMLITLCAVYMPAGEKTALRFSTMGTLRLPAVPVFYIIGMLAAASGLFCIFFYQRSSRTHTVGMIVNAFLILVTGYPAEDCEVPNINKKPLQEIATFLE